MSLFTGFSREKGTSVRKYSRHRTKTQSEHSGRNRVGLPIWSLGSEHGLFSGDGRWDKQTPEILYLLPRKLPSSPSFIYFGVKIYILRWFTPFYSLVITPVTLNSDGNTGSRFSGVRSVDGLSGFSIMEHGRRESSVWVRGNSMRIGREERRRVLLCYRTTHFNLTPEKRRRFTRSTRIPSSSWCALTHVRSSHMPPLRGCVTSTLSVSSPFPSPPKGPFLRTHFECVKLLNVV